MHRRAAALCWFPPDSAVAIAADSIDPWLIAYTASLLLLLFLLLLHTSVTGLKNFTGDSRYDFCCCAVSSTHCYLQCLLRALSWVVAHPDTSATHRSSESSSSSSSFVKYSLLLRPVALDPKAEELCLLFIGVAIRRSLRFVPDDGEPTARIICPRWRERPGNLNLQNHHHHHLAFFFIHIMPT